MTKTLEQFGRELTGFGSALERAHRLRLNEASLVMKKGIQASFAAAGGGSGRLRGVGRRGGKIGVRYDVQAAGGLRAFPTSLIRATGQAQLLERDTKPHRIVPRARRGAQALAIPGVGPRASAQHPGTKGKHPFERGVVATAPAAARILAQSPSDALRTILR